MRPRLFASVFNAYEDHSFQSLDFRTVIGGGWAIEQLWLFWVAPIAGAILASYLYRCLGEEWLTVA